MVAILPVLLGGCVPGGTGEDANSPITQAAAACTTADLAGTWHLENQSTWNEITLDEAGAVTDANHPHGVTSAEGAFTITTGGDVEGWYTIVDDESLENVPPQPQGTWAVTVTGTLRVGKTAMTLDYTVEYTPEGESTETYTGTWNATKQ